MEGALQAKARFGISLNRHGVQKRRNVTETELHYQEEKES